MPTAGRFAGQVSIVTGGGGNIGRATARLLASEGSAVTVADLSESAAARVVAEIEAAGGTARAQPADVTDPAAVEAMVRDTVAAYGGIDVPDNNAAQDALGGPMGERLRRYTTSHLVGRLGYPEEIAAAVAYLASDDGAFITGETLRVDGGMTAHGPAHVPD